MINVKLIKKPKGKGLSSDKGIATNGNGYTPGGVVKEAAHAGRADLAIYADRAGEANEAAHAKAADSASKATHAQSAHDLDSDSPVRDQFLSKLKDDYTQHKVGSSKAFEVGRYEAGSSGGIIGIDGGGDSFAEVARLYVRVRAFFESLTVINADVLAGKQYVTPGGGIVCTRVEETLVAVNGQAKEAYRCYFLSEQDGEKTETRMMAGDQATAQMFNAKTGTANKVSNHRYWRLVLAVSNDAYTDESGNHYGYIDLSKNDRESGSDIPQPGDHICQLGYRGLPQWPDRPERQTAMVFSTVDADAPSIHMYSGINSFSLSGKSVISFGQDPDTHKVYFRLGASGAQQYLDYKDGVLTVNGKISVTSTIGGKDIDTFIGDKVEGLRQSVGVYRVVAEGEVSPVGCDAAGAVTGAYPVPHVHVYRGMELLTSGVTYAG